MRCNRTVVVRDLVLNSITSASVLQVGDSAAVRPRSRVFAVQREIAFFLLDEGGFSNYPLFTQTIPQPSLEHNVHLRIFNENPAILVYGIDITAIAASSVVKLGNTRLIDAESRILNIRQLLRGERPVGPPKDLEDDED